MARTHDSMSWLQKTLCDLHSSCRHHDHSVHPCLHPGTLCVRRVGVPAVQQLRSGRTLALLLQVGGMQRVGHGDLARKRAQHGALELVVIGSSQSARRVMPWLRCSSARSRWPRTDAMRSSFPAGGAGSSRQ